MRGWFGRAGSIAREVRFYAGAAYNRLMADFNDPQSSADQANLWALRPLRNRARQLERDAALAIAYTQLAQDNIIGPDGFQLRVTGTDAAVSASIEAAFLAWGDHTECTTSGRLSFTDVERLMVRRWRGADGEFLVRLVRGVGRFGLQLQVLDPDVLDENYNLPRTDAHARIVQGVEQDDLGRPIAYWMWNHPPTESHPDKRRVRVPADDIIHVYSADRPGQTRGITPFAPVLRNLWHLAGMQHAVLMGQRVAAMQMGFLIPTTEDASPIQNPTEPAKPVQVKVEPAAFTQLPTGFDVKSWAPAMPNGYYADFLRTEQQHIASGLGVTYASLTGDASQANYGSQRGMLLRERRMWRVNQEQARESFHERVFAEWLRMAAISGAVRLRGADPSTVSSEWLMPTWPWIDPLKDAQTAALEVAIGINSLTAVCAANGRDFATVLRQRAAEIALAEQLNVPLFLPTSLGLPGDEPADAAAAASTSGKASDIRLVRAS